MRMLLIVHIVIALTSLIYGAVAVFRPSQSKLIANFALIDATLLSGTFLVIRTHSPVLQSCLSGLTYVCVMAAMSAVSYRRLARQAVTTG